MKRKKHKQRVKLHWASHVKYAKGNAFGYSTHNATLRKYFEQIGEITPSARDALLILAPEFYEKRTKGYRNWLFTMFEGNDIPHKYYENMQQADCLIAPSSWVAALFREYFDKPIFTVPHGVEKHFTYKKRMLPANKPFRFLWVGAPNPRKGYEEISHIWQKVFARNPKVELYIKTTGLRVPYEKRGNVILDGRKLSKGKLVQLYHSSHCFVFPTRGEGFGLTLAEAMRTGLPCISTNYSGVTEFFSDKVGYPVDYKMGKGSITFVGDSNEVETEVAFPYVEQIVEHMLQIISDYPSALIKGKLAHEHIKKRFTWNRSARILLEALQAVK